MRKRRRRGKRDLFLTEQLFSVFEKADNNHDRRPDEAEEEHQLQNTHSNDREYHAPILAYPDVLHSPQYATELKVAVVEALGRRSSFRGFA
ncbi:hypothetical protein SBA5_60030 [Candidatus Sulfotelmatomonas gaucii]|uniref:Uncharacterized protein n=1 Tax=Candidatus Sulfuritelmatomonas gaucii TaxID=2043161 RepID=A0A2N9LWT5_9BACT|nr:hypothetical protein SBA5_60030 [Candidatus Sulfotelmatomonas gaucii]